MNLCMAATYDPDPHAPLGFRIPFNAESGEPIRERWANWRRNDPVNLVTKYRESPKTLRGIYIECGWRDQYHIHYGTRLLSKRLADAGIKHRYQEFDDDHSDIFLNTIKSVRIIGGSPDCAAAIRNEEDALVASGLCRSDDPHILGLARRTGARLICTNDEDLQRDFRNTQILGGARGRIYKRAEHRQLLFRNDVCPK